MTIEYNPNTPKQGDSVGEWQKPFLDNFITIFNAFKKNHVSLDAGATAGNHTFAEFFKQVIPIQTSVGEVSIYSKNVEEQTEQLFLRYQNNVEIQLSNYQIYKPENNPTQIKYFTVLPGKLILYFGQFTANASGNILDLTPYVAKNIITMSCCNVGTTPRPRQIVQPLAPKGKIIQGLTIVNSFFNQPFPNIYYMVLANI